MEEHSAADFLVLDKATADFFDHIYEGHLADVKLQLLTDRTVLVDVRNITGETGLIASCRLGHIDLVKFFCSQEDCDLDACDNECWSGLLNAAKCGFTEIVRLLLDSGADIEITDAFGWTAVSWAAYKNQMDVLGFLLERGANPHIIDDDGMTTLAYACGRGYTQVVKCLVAENVDVNTADKFGSSPLLWASRKGYVEIVECLLSASADVNAAGMYSATPLILATRGNFQEVVDLLLQHEPNVNAVDEDGCTALSVAAREGYAEIAKALMESGAYVNVSDRRGDSVLCSAVKGGHLDIVRTLLYSYADVNSRAQDGRTALHIAVDRGYADIVVALLESRPNLELRTEDGDTALIRAVRNRNALVVQLLGRSGAKVSTADPKGDNCLHLALRARSKRITQILLMRPKDARLLYRPNSDGETPYSIDQSHSEPILPHIFGPVESQAQTEAMMGYDIYSNVLADILCEPTLSLPLNIGLYAKWGSGKSFLLNKMKEAMTVFSRNWLDSVELTWSWSVVVSVLFLGCFLSLLVYAPSIGGGLGVVDWIAALCVGVISSVGLIGAYAVLYYGSQVKSWTRFLNVGNHVGKLTAKWNLLGKVLFCQPPTLREKDFLAFPVSFLFADYHRLSSVGGEQALGKIVTTLIDAVEKHFGRCTTRLSGALRPEHVRGNKTKMKRVCGVPVVFVFVAAVITLLLALFLFAYYGHSYYYYSVGGEMEGQNGTATPVGSIFESANASVFVSASVLLVLVLLIGTYPVLMVVRNCFSSGSRRRLNKAVRQLDKIRFEGFMQLLQQEVDSISDIICCLDSFTQSQTRLVVFVDGLDNCEQERMVQTLDALELLFCSRQRNRRPFIVIIAVDPHIIISAINRNIHSALSGTELSGHDYLKNMVHMPFYLQNSALRRLQEKLRQRSESLEHWKARFLRSETLYGSFMSLTDGFGRMKRVVSQHLANHPAGGHSSLSQTIVRDDYFSNLNPRSMKRIMNTLNLTGRLMRAFEVEFSWVLLGQWLSLVEQWPYRVSWIIDYCEETEGIPDSVSLKEIYDIVKTKIPVLRTEDRLVDIDRNAQNLDMHLAAASNRGDKVLLVGHLRNFVPCTSSLDPYIKKLIKERRLAADNPGGNFIHRPSFLNAETFYVGEGLQPSPSRTLVQVHTDPLPAIPVGPARNLFPDQSMWTKLPRLSSMTPTQVADTLKQTNISDAQKEIYAKGIVDSNLSGLVLSICELDDVRSELQMSLGDWILFKLLVETLRERNHLPNPVESQYGALEVQASSNDSVVLDPSPRSMDSRGARKRGNFANTGRAASIEQKEAEAHSQWLEERFGKLDSTEFAGDLEVLERMSCITNHSHSTRSSVVQFAPTAEGAKKKEPDFEVGLNDAASSGDSTASMFGSAGNLLEMKKPFSGESDKPVLTSDFGSKWAPRQAEMVRVTEDDELLVDTSSAQVKQSRVRSSSKSPSLKGTVMKLVDTIVSPSGSKKDDSSDRQLSVDQSSVSETESEENQLTVKFRPQGGKPSLFEMIGGSKSVQN